MEKLTFNQYFNENKNYIYGAINNIWRQYKDFLLFKGIDKDDLIQECLLNLISGWEKFDSSRGSANTFVSLKIKSCCSGILIKENAEKRKCDLVYLDKVNDGFNESVENCIQDENVIDKLSDENDNINILTSLLKNEVKAKAFRLYLQGYSYKEMKQKLYDNGINISESSLRQGVSTSKKYIRKHYTRKELEDMLI